MSKLKSATDRKPPLAESPNRLRPRQILHSNSISIQIPSASVSKTQLPNRFFDLEELELLPEYQSISCQLQALSKMVEEEFGNYDLGNDGFANTFSLNSSTLFERGRFYDEYSARRNERLKRKKSKTGEEKRTTYNLGVTVESGKKRDSKKLESLRKSVPANFSIGRMENVRYSLRSSKENRKSALSVVGGGERKFKAGRVRKS